MKVLKFVLIFTITTQFVFADLCHFVYSPNQSKILSPDLAHIEKINRLENLSNLMRGLRTKGGEEFSLMTRKLREEFKVIEGLIFKGDIDLAIKKWRTVFRKVEVSAIEANNYNLMIKGLNKGIRLHVAEYESFLIHEGVPKYLISSHINELYRIGPRKYLEVLHKRLRKHHRTLGNNFEKYKFIKNNLDDLSHSAHCTAVCRQAIKDLKSEIGITSRAQRHMHTQLVQNRKTIKLSTVENIFNSHPEAVIIARRKEFINESIGLLAKYFNNANLMRRLYFYLGNSAAGKNLKLVRMFKRIFDHRYHSVNKGIIDKVSNSNLSSKGQLDLIKVESKFSDYNSILVDMSRSSDRAAVETWKGLKNYAQASNKRISLLNELNEAEQLGIKIGKTSQRLPRDISALIGTMVIGGGFVGYMLFDVEADENRDDQTDSGIIIIDNDDIDQIQTDDDVIILKYNSDLDTQFREQLLEVVDSLTRAQANMSAVQ